MATSVWKGYLTFGLISIPIRLFSAARSERIGLNQLHSVCHTRIKMPLFCPTCNRMVERSEIVKGYEYEKDQYVLFDEKELDKIEPESARSMEFLEFVRLEEIDPLYYESSYYVTPEDEGMKAYQLLLDAMEQAGQEVTEVPHAKMAQVIDLMEALKKSIAEKQQPGAKKPPVRAISSASTRPQEQAQQQQNAKRKKSAG